MTHIPEILPPGRRGGRTILFIAFPQVGLLDLTGPQTVFWAASRYLEEQGSPGYRRHTVSPQGGMITSAEGVALHTLPLARFARTAIDTIVVPGSPAIERAVDANPRLVAWLRRSAPRVRRMASVCSGSFLLAQAGLLDGRRAATHWMMCDRLQARFPAVEVDRDSIFVEQGPVWTSAGVTAGIDLALALVEMDCGRGIAMRVARELVVFLKRPGGQSQFSELLRSQTEDGAPFDDLHRWIASHLASGELTVEGLAGRTRMSPRNFARVYRQRTGRTPAKAVELFRLEAARRLLEEPSRSIDRIARHCGFGDAERMRTTFHRHLGVSPAEYRKRFAR